MQRNAIGKGKRTLEGGEDEQPARKRPALPSVIVEAFKEDSLQKLCPSLLPKLCSSLEPILHRVVSEEVERALAKLGPARLKNNLFCGIFVFKDLTSFKVCKLLSNLSDWSGWRMVTLYAFKMLLQEQVYVDYLVKTAYDNWDQVVEYDGKTFLPGNGLDRQQPQSALPVTASSKQQLNSGLHVGGYNDTLAITYPTQPLISNSYSRNQFDSSSFVSQDQLLSNHQPQSSRNDHGAVGLPLGCSQPSTSGFHVGSSSIQPATLNPFEEWSHNRDRGVDEFLSEEEIRIRNHEMGGHAPLDMQEDCYAFPQYMASPMPNFDEDSACTGRAVVG